MLSLIAVRLCPSYLAQGQWNIQPLVDVPLLHDVNQNTCMRACGEGVRDLPRTQPAAKPTSCCRCTGGASRTVKAWIPFLLSEKPHSTTSPSHATRPPAFDDNVVTTTTSPVHSSATKQSIATFFIENEFSMPGFTGPGNNRSKASRGAHFNSTNRALPNSPVGNMTSAPAQVNHSADIAYFPMVRGFVAMAAYIRGKCISFLVICYRAAIALRLTSRACVAPHCGAFGLIGQVVCAFYRVLTVVFRNFWLSGAQW